MALLQPRGTGEGVGVRQELGAPRGNTGRAVGVCREGDPPTAQRMPGGWLSPTVPLHPGWVS